MKGSAKLSEDRKYRYVLGRSWGDGEVQASLTWVMINPSTALASKNDPTIRRCIEFTRREGYDALWVVNLFALRSSDPKELKLWDDPVGPDNDRWIEWAVRKSASVVLAWGNNGRYWTPRIREVRNLIEPIRPKFLCLGLTGSLHPRHPLMLSKYTEFEEYRFA